MSANVTRLPPTFDSTAEAGACNARLKDGTAALDWSQVIEVSDEALAALSAGLALDEVLEQLGHTTMSPAILGRVAAAFDKGKPPRPKRRRQSRRAGTTGPAKGTSEEKPEPAQETPEEETTAPPAPAPVLSAPPETELRQMLEDMVVKDLLGPAKGPDEELEESSVRDRYLVGMLAPRRLRVRPGEIDRLEVEEGRGNEEGVADDSGLASPTMFPSSIGMSFCVERQTTEVQVTGRWGRYRKGPSETGFETKAGNPKTVWQRTQIQETVTVELPEEGPVGPYPVGADSMDPHPTAEIRGVAHRLGEATVVSLFLVNMQDEPDERRDEAWLFQPQLLVEAGGAPVFVSRVVEEDAAQSDERIMAMVLRNRRELAVGHGVAVHVTVDPSDPRRAVRVETRVVPTAEVRRQEPPSLKDQPGLSELVLDMKALAEGDPATVSARLEALPREYESWIAKQAGRIGQTEAHLDGYEPEARQALDHCTEALGRIRAGISLLREDDNAARAFVFANRAMWNQRVHSLHSEARRQGSKKTLEEIDQPDNRTWYVFQLAFILLNLESITKLDHPDRSDPSRAIADLLWFPTGGGKTEAYLGLAAYTMALRRLQGEVEGLSGDAGVAVLMRYTLRLLTLQQFQRAATLMCACEVIRRSDEPTWGREPFRIGLWVGARSTPNRTKHADESLKRTRDVRFQQSSTISGLGSPVQLKSCPWCGSTIHPGRNMKVEPFNSSIGRTLTYCGDKLGRCPFTERQAKNEGLPVVVVDEEVYRRLPTLLIATVDKYAQMPWNGIVQMLFGRVDKVCPRHGFVASDLDDTSHPKRGALPGTKLKEHSRLRPPDLIIQDELHLISGPLGTLTGLYETAVDELCSWEVEGKKVRPKVVASTATIRRAGQQIHSLFLRQVRIFPPQALDVEDNFFSKERSDAWGRRYIGICAPGRRLKAAIIRVYVAYLSAAQALYEKYGSHADPWMTLVGYFSSLRELAGTRRLVDDDISSRLKRMDRRGLQKRYIRAPRELTSRMGSTEIPDLLDLLERGFSTPAVSKKGARSRTPRPIDVLLATNMISVGVDVKRLGLMAVSGQPKNTAEYIQATSRVGRSHPGIVCTIYNWARPRDLSHYETFEHYHATFYGHVEALSVTPFAPRAVDRGLSALLVSLIRLTEPKYSRNEAAAKLERSDPIVQDALNVIATRAELVEQRKSVGVAVRRGLERRLDEWLHQATPREGGARLGYKAKKDGTTVALLTRPGLGPWQTFTCLNSLRDVEPTVDLVLEEGRLDDDDRGFKTRSR